MKKVQVIITSSDDDDFWYDDTGADGFTAGCEAVEAELYDKILSYLDRKGIREVMACPMKECIDKFLKLGFKIEKQREPTECVLTKGLVTATVMRQRNHTRYCIDLDKGEILDVCGELFDPRFPPDKQSIAIAVKRVLKRLKI